MKGTIAKCIQELVEEKFGPAAWEAVTKKVASLPPVFLPISDIDDAKVMEIVKAVCEVGNLTLSQVADAFGDYWVNTYAQKYYSMFFKSRPTAKDLILSMDDVHAAMTKNMANAHPPRFQYSWKNDHTLLMTYSSERNLIDFLMSLLKGVGKFYRTNLTITKLSPQQVEIVFP